MPAGDDVTVPVPCTITVRVTCRENVAVTEAAAVIHRSNGSCVYSITAPEIADAKSMTVAFCQHPFCIDNVYNGAGLPMLPFVYALEA